MKLFRESLALLIFMTILTGLLYPLAITLVSQAALPEKANGSLAPHAVGSFLIAQKFEKPIYFWPRPSAVDFNPIPSGATNLGPISDDLKKQVEKRRSDLLAANGKTPPDQVPQDLITASGSGLDPHISPEAAYFQAARVAKNRNLGPEGERTVISLIDSLVEKRDFGVLGEPRVNVLKLNLALDEKLKH